MIDLLLLPFMCLSLSNHSTVSEVVDNKSLKFNEIASQTGNKLFMDGDYKKTYLEKKMNLPCYKGEYSETKSGNKTYLTAEEMKLPTGNMRYFNRVLDVSGSLSRNNSIDVYYFNVDDRMLTECRFSTEDENVTAYISNENRQKLFDVFKKKESEMTPNGLLKKGAYYLTVVTNSNSETNYKVNICASYADTNNKLKIDDAFMKKYKAVVWESDYIPGAVDPIDGTVIEKAYKPGRRSPWSYTGRFISGDLDKPYLYRSTYIWTKDAFDDLDKDINLYKSKIKDVADKANKVIAKWNTVSTATGDVSFFVSFIPVVGNVLGTALSTVSMTTSLIATCLGSESEIDSTLTIRQCDRIQGALEKRTFGTIVSFKETVTVKSYTNDSKYTKRHYKKIKFGPYLDYANDDTYKIIDRGIDESYPSYDAYLGHGSDDEIASDCQGTFTAYEDYKDIKPLALLEE